MEKITDRIFNIRSDEEFESLALEIFGYQYSHNLVYRHWCDLLKIRPGLVERAEHIPCLPVEFFKSHAVFCGQPRGNELTFTSSTTSSQTPSRHMVKDPGIYERSYLEGFRLFYGDPEDYCFLALLPSYLERSGSSLVTMCEGLIRRSRHSLSGFFLHDTDKLISSLNTLIREKQKTILIGVSYALLDLAGKGLCVGPEITVMETGGMKGTRREMLKPELHQRLMEAFGSGTIHSEYGMTEMLSQFYSKGQGIFQSPPWLRCNIREITDPLAIRKDGKTGGLNVIDLANLHSCSFIATKDLGRMHGEGLELMGRYDNSDIRGCNLMVGS